MIFGETSSTGAPRPSAGSPVRPRVCPVVPAWADKTRLPEPISLRSPQYLPKGTDLSVHSADDLARIAASLNNRPRKTLGFMKPSEKLTGLLAHTA